MSYDSLRNSDSRFLDLDDNEVRFVLRNTDSRFSDLSDQEIDFVSQNVNMYDEWTGKQSDTGSAFNTFVGSMSNITGGFISDVGRRVKDSPIGQVMMLHSAANNAAGIPQIELTAKTVGVLGDSGAALKAVGEHNLKDRNAYWQEAAAKKFMNDDFTVVEGSESAWKDPRAYANLGISGLASTIPVIASTILLKNPFIGTAIEAGAESDGAREEVFKRLDTYPDSIYEDLPDYMALTEDGLGKAASIRAIKSKIANEAADQVYLTTAAISGVGDKVLGDTLLGKVKGGVTKRLATNLGAQAVTESAQGGFSQAIQNANVARIDENQPLMEGVADASVKEGLGGLMGAAPISAYDEIVNKQMSEKSKNSAAWHNEIEAAEKKAANGDELDQVELGAIKQRQSIDFDQMNVRHNDELIKVQRKELRPNMMRDALSNLLQKGIVDNESDLAYSHQQNQRADELQQSINDQGLEQEIAISSVNDNKDVANNPFANLKQDIEQKGKDDARQSVIDSANAIADVRGLPFLQGKIVDKTPVQLGTAGIEHTRSNKPGEHYADQINQEAVYGLNGPKTVSPALLASKLPNMPKNLQDPRLQDGWYRGAINAMSKELEVNSGGDLIPDMSNALGEADKPGDFEMKRTASNNPEWFKNGSFAYTNKNGNKSVVGVRDFKSAIDNALSGKFLKDSEKRIVTEALNMNDKDVQAQVEHEVNNPVSEVSHAEQEAELLDTQDQMDRDSIADYFTSPVTSPRGGDVTSSLTEAQVDKALAKISKGKMPLSRTEASIVKGLNVDAWQSRNPKGVKQRKKGMIRDSLNVQAQSRKDTSEDFILDLPSFKASHVTPNGTELMKLDNSERVEYVDDFGERYGDVPVEPLAAQSTEITADEGEALRVDLKMTAKKDPDFSAARFSAFHKRISKAEQGDKEAIQWARKWLDDIGVDTRSAAAKESQESDEKALAEQQQEAETERNNIESKRKISEGDYSDIGNERYIAWLNFLSESERKKLFSPVSKRGVANAEFMYWSTAGRSEPDGSQEITTINSYKSAERASLKALDGDLSPAEYLVYFDALRESKGVILAELEKSNTKQKLLKLLQPMAAYQVKNDKKASVVKSVYDMLVSRFHLGDSIGYDPFAGPNAYGDAIRGQVKGYTQEKIDLYKSDLAEKRSEYKTKRESMVKAVTNPETLEEFQNFIRINGRSELSDVQRAAHDALVAEQQLEDKPVIKQGLNAEGAELSEITEGVHGKTGEQIFNIKVVSRLGTEKFKEAAGFARSLGGGYWRGEFYFKTREDAELFEGWVNGGDADLTERKMEKKEERKGATASKLRDMAERLESSGNEALNIDRKTNTHKRIEEAASAVASAEGQINFAKIMKVVADKVETGEFKFLKNMTQKIQVSLINQAINSLKYSVPQNEISEYFDKDGDSDLTWKEGVADETKVKFLSLPFYDMHKSSVSEYAAKMAGTSGFKQSGAVLKSTVAKSDKSIIKMRVDSKHAQKLFDYVIQHESSHSYAKERAMDFRRLQRMGIASREAYRSAALEFMKAKKEIEFTGGKKSELQKLESKLQRKVIGNRNAFNNFFPTPEATASEVVEFADIEAGMKVLEPSAGNGMLADAIQHQGVDPDVIEISADLREILAVKGYSVVANDFLEYDTGGYDRIVMNPPFAKDQDIDHVMHAYKLTKPGGKIVAIMSSSAGDRQNSKNKKFREFLDGVAADEQSLEEGAFKSSMNPTGVNTKIVVIDKPEADSNGADDVAFFSKADYSSDKSIGEEGLKLEIDAFIKSLPGIEEYGLSFRVYGSPDQAFGKEAVAAARAETSSGAYLPKSKKVILFYSNISNKAAARRVLRHEILAHHGLNLFEPSVKAEILASVSNTRNNPLFSKDWKTIDSRYPDDSESVKAEEVIALIAEPDPSLSQRFIDTLVNAILAILKKIGFIKRGEIVAKSQLRELVNKISKGINHGVPQRTHPKDDSSQYSKDDKPLFSKKDSDPETEVHSMANKFEKSAYDSLADNFSRMTKFSRNQAIKLLTNNQIGEIFAPVFSRFEVNPVDNFVRGMQNFEGELASQLSHAEDIKQKWDKLSIEDSNKLSQFMSDSTFYGFDLTEGFDPIEVADSYQSKIDAANHKISVVESQMNGRPGDAAKLSGKIKELHGQIMDLRKRKKNVKTQKMNHAIMQNHFNQLSDGAKSLYVEVRDAYQDQFDTQVDELVNRIKRTVADKSEQIKLIGQVSERFKQLSKHDVYFPLARFGDHFVMAELVDKESGELDYMRLHFESERAAVKASEELKKDGWTVRRSTSLSQGENLFGDVPAFAEEVINLFDGQMPGAKTGGESYRDAIYQLLLQQMPEVSMLKRSIHRKYVAGFSLDQKRAFGKSMFHGAYRIAKIKHGDLVSQNLKNIKEAVDAGDGELISDKDNVKAATIYDRLLARFEDSMNPRGNQIAAGLTQFGFMYYLGGSIGAGLINLTQTPLFTAPYLGAKFGFGKTTAEMLRATKDYMAAEDKRLSLYDSLSSLERSKTIKKSERDMISQLIEQGVIENTQTHSLAQLSEQNTMVEQGHLRENAVRAIGWVYHNAEVMNREVTALASYRLAVKDGLPHNAAVEVARKTIYDTHFDYSYHNRAEFMRSNLAKVVFLFKNYAQQASYLIISSGIKALKGDREAQKFVIGSTLAHLAIAGSIGLPVASLIAGIASAISNDDEYEFDQAYRKWLKGIAEKAGADDPSQVAEAVMHGMFNAYLGMDIHSRVGIDLVEMWVRPDDIGDRSPMHDLSVALTGPIGSLVFNGVDRAAGNIANGDTWKGLNTFIPVKGLRDLSKSIEMNVNGIYTRTGDEIIAESDVTKSDVFLKSTGITPSEVSRRYERNHSIREVAVKIGRKSSKLKMKLYKAHKSNGGGSPEFTEALNEVYRFNEEYPTFAINANASLKSRYRGAGTTDEFGLRINKGNAEIADDYEMFSDR